MLERIITALILVAVVLSCMFVTTSNYPMYGLMILAVLGAGYEWFKLVPFTAEQSGIRAKAWGFAIVLSIIALFVFLSLQYLWILFWICSILIWLMSIYWVRHYPEYDAWYNKNLIVVGALLIIAAVTAIFSLWSYSPWWLMYLFLLVWGADSGAYFVGRKFGMRKLAPLVSPNKSIEGLCGGILTSSIIIVTVSLLYLDLGLLPFISFLLLSLVTVMASVLGDLFESMIKRRVGVKDSGRIFPGHGGVLDRVDSLLAAAPIFAAGLFIFKILGFNI